MEKIRENYQVFVSLRVDKYFLWLWFGVIDNQSINSPKISRIYKYWHCKYMRISQTKGNCCIRDNGPLWIHWEVKSRKFYEAKNIRVSQINIRSLFIPFERYNVFPYKNNFMLKMLSKINSQNNIVPSLFLYARTKMTFAKFVPWADK